MGRKTRAQKYRHEKRRITRRKQRGGAEIKSIDDWITAVNESPAFVKAIDEFKLDPKREVEAQRLGNYKFSALKRDELRYPDFSEYKRDFDIDVYAGITSAQKLDIRQEAATAADILRDVLPANPTPYDFKNYMIDLREATLKEDMNRSRIFLAGLEEKLRKSVSTDPNVAVKILEDDSKYPLYLWALVMNMPLKYVEPGVTLVPEEDPTVSVNSTSSDKAENPDQPAVPEAQAS